MKIQMIQKDFMKNKAVMVSIIGFIAIASALLSMAAILGTNLFGSIDRMMADAKTPHFMQMHSGDLDLEQLQKFARNTEDVEEFQVLPFLGIDGDQIWIEGKPLTDSLQVVSEGDYSRLEPFGAVEQLIEFRLNDIENLDRFAAAYSTSGMPASGPSLTWSLFRMISAISDGIMIAVILLVSLLIILIALLCVRFTLLAKMEEDYREIGTMKAIGMRLSDIRRLYLFTYGSLASIGCVLGLIITLLLYNPILANIRRFRKLSAVHAIRFGVEAAAEKKVKNLRIFQSKYLGVNFSLGLRDVFIRKRLYDTMLVVVAVAAFIIVVPQNLYHTISSRDFVSYMGVGRCDLRMDIQQAENIEGRTDQISKYAAAFLRCPCTAP